MSSAPSPVRLCFAAAHIALHDSYEAAGHSLDHPGTPTEIAPHLDWDTTMAVRRRLAELGFGIAEAMDTAQRFFLGWEIAEELIARCAAERLPHGFCAGAGTDHLDEIRGPEDLIDGVTFQARRIRELGGIPVLLPMPWLSEHDCDAETYVAVYRGIVDRLDGPAFLHWLGPMFLPSLAGYFPGNSFLEVMALNRAKLRGCKLSLLDDALELRVRRELLPHDQIVLTGDDFHFGRLMLGGDPAGTPPTTPPTIERWTTIGQHRVALGDFSHALLGVLDGIARPASQALTALARGDADEFLTIMTPCETLGQHVFAAPTRHYKAGLAWLARQNGWQPNAMLINREDRARDAAHYARCEELARACGALVRGPGERA
ncbi:MAG: dihydrodipicolinate synthase family protein [bacterium]|nr:dihydrodipicolinate synthase family protein [bacterium]